MAYICSAFLPSPSLYFLPNGPRDILPQTAVSSDLINNNVYIAFPNLILALCSQIKCVRLCCEVHAKDLSGMLC